MLLCSITTFSQIDDPYKIFGHNSNVKYEMPVTEMLYIKNKDTSSNIKAMAFDIANNKLKLLGSNDKILQEIPLSANQILRWLSIDPKASKYPNVTPYNYVDNNPILKIDPDGADWIISTYKNKQGQTQINLTFAGAILNNSGQKINMQNLVNNQMKAFETVFGQGNVHANLRVHEISSAKDLKWHESLIEILPPSSFDKTKDGYVGGDSRYGGKYIRINSGGINSDGTLKDKKAIVHEIGHTGGLMHPWEFADKESNNFVNGNPFSVGVQSYNNVENSTEINSNFMNYTGTAMKSYPYVADKSYLQNLFQNNIGKATQGQAQQVVNNLYEGNLNSEKDIPKR